MAIEPHFQALPLHEKIIVAARGEGLIIFLDNEVSDWGNEFKGLNSPHSLRPLITIELTEKYYQDCIIQKKEYRTLFPQLTNDYLKSLDELFKKSNKALAWFLEEVALNPLSVYFSSGEEKLYFTLKSLEEEVQIKAWEQMNEIISKIKSGDKEIFNWLNSIPQQKNKMHFLIYGEQDDNWKLINRLLDATLRLSTEFRKSINDDRISKPHLVFNEDNYNQYMYFDKQWTLHLENFPLIMTQPNDIALYVALTDKNLIAAESFFEKELADKTETLYMPLLRTEETLEYYNYFETIIAAIIFSYTSLETLANICILPEYAYKKVIKGKLVSYSKEDIERSFSLKEKFKTILKEILKTPDPTMEQWWEPFIHLESIRNEIIHTKQSKSEERFSLFLSKKIFEWIKVNKQIIRYYGSYIDKHARRLLFDFPYDFGFDDVPPTFMSDKDYRSHWEALHNPWKPPEKDLDD